MSRCHAALLLSLPPLLPMLLCGGCSTSHSYLRIHSGNTLAEQHDDGPAFVASYRNGEILGAETANEPEFPLRDWLHGEFVDHPEIPRWRVQLARMQELAAGPDTRAQDLIRAAAGFPFDAAVAESCSLWVAGDAGRAAEVLDAGSLDLGDDFAELLARTAVGADASDDRVADWVRTLTHADHDEAVLALVTSPRAGPRTAATALGRIDDYPASDRLAVFAAAARIAIADPAAAYGIVEAAEALPSADESAALLALLDGDAPAAFARQVLRRIDDRPSSERARLFARAAERSYFDPRNHIAIAQALRDLPAVQRLDAASALVARPDAPEPLIVLLVDGAGELRSSDREEFLLGVLDGPHGGITAVRDACADAARRHLPARGRERVLARLGREGR